MIEIDSLDDPRFTDLFTTCTDSAWQLKTLPVYDVPSQQDALKRFLGGQRCHIPQTATPWIESVLTPAVEKDIAVGRVHVIERTVDDKGNLDLGDYISFALALYAHNRAAGENIRIAWTEPGRWLRNVWKRGSDFWVFDAETANPTVAEMHYTPEGTFRLAVIYDKTHRPLLARALQCKKAAMQASRPFHP